MTEVKVIGAGLAGCEAAWQLAKRDIPVRLMEMKPEKMTPAHHSGDFAELVCSNSLRGDRLENAVGLLKEELRHLDSLILSCADATRVEAGGCLAVDRHGFSQLVTERIRSHPRITVEATEVTQVPQGPVIVATGPLTSDALSAGIAQYFGQQEYLHFFDAAAPLVTFGSIDMEKAWFASRYDRGSADYINCALDREQYDQFWKALTEAQEAEVHGFEDRNVFEGCMPVEVMARRGYDTLRYGPLKPVGLKDPKTGREPYAVVQLRRDNAAGTVYNLVGFQTHLRFPEQKRVFSMIPALANGEFVRYGVMHRNTFLDSPRLLDRFYADRRDPLVAFAGQMTGVEGYVESTASGCLAAIAMAARLQGKQPPEFPRETAIGALALYVSDESVSVFQPMNVNFGIISPLDRRVKGKAQKNLAIAQRALEVLDRMVQNGEVVGVIAAQSIGEPGTQLTLRTFHVGGIASNIATENSITSKYDGILEIDELRAVEAVDEVSGKKHLVVVSRLAEMRIVDPNTKIVLLTHNIPYGSKLFFNNGDPIKKGDVIIEWDPFNAVIVSEVSGKIEFESLVENVTYKVESDETTGLKEKIIIESKDKTKAPAAHIVDENGNYLKNYSLPLGAHVVKDNGDVVKAGEVLVKIPRAVGKAGDITGGLPRVTELFEARNPSNPAVVSEIDGEVGFGKIKRGNREITVTSKLGEVKKYMVPLSKQLLVQENDYIRAGMPLSDGATTPSDILAIKGPTAVQEYIVNEVQDVYRLQGVKINDKHIEVIVRQMMRKVEVVDPGDTRFLEQQIVDKLEVMDENDRIWGKKVVTDPGDSQTLQAGQIVTARKLRDENSMLKRRDLKLVEVRDAIPATANQILQGITRAALQTNSFMSAASFQETTKVLNEAAINGKVDRLEGLKENVICGHLIPAGTGQREFDKLIVGAKDEFDRIFANRKNVVDFNAMDKDDEE